MQKHRKGRSLFGHLQNLFYFCGSFNEDNRNMLFESQIIDLMRDMPAHKIEHEKEQMRGLDSQRRRVMTPEEVKTDSRKIVDQIERMSCWKDAKTVMLYYPIHNEVDLRHLVHVYADEKTFLLPATVGGHKIEVRRYEKNRPLKKGQFGIPEPDTEAWTGSIDLILVPGVAFGTDRFRLGRGGGYYDRFLKFYEHTMKIGVCYDFQLHEDLPSQFFDIQMDRVVTPSKTIG